VDTRFINTATLVSKYLWAFFGCLVLIIVGTLTLVTPAEAVTVSINPASTNLPAAGQTFTVSIKVSDVSDCGGFQLQVDYDPAVVRISETADVSLDSFLSSTGRAAELIIPRIDNNVGLLTAAGYTYGMADAPSGEGSLLKIIFTVVSRSDSTLVPKNVILTNATAREIGVDRTENCTLTSDDSNPVDPSQGTIGTQFTISGQVFGEKKGKVLIGSGKCQVLDWTDTSVRCLIKKVPSTMPPGIYNVTVQPKGKGMRPAVIEKAFTIMAPQIDTITPSSGVANDEIKIEGKFFGTKKAKVYMEDGIKKKKCKVSFQKMDSKTGESELRMRVPKGLHPRQCDVTVTNKVGEDTRLGGFTIQ